MPLIGFSGAPVHAGELPDRGRTEPDLRPDEGADVRGAGRLRAPPRGARRHRGRTSPRPGRCRRAGGAALRLVGGGAGPRRLSPLRVPAHGEGVRGDRRHGCAGDPLRGRYRPSAGPDAGRGGRRLRRRPPRPARRRLGDDRSRSRDPGEPRSRPSCSAPGMPSSGRLATSSRARATGRDTCSTSATACFPTRRSNISSGWWTWCIRRPRGAARDRAGGRARDGVRHRERSGGHRALLHGHPRWPRAHAGAPRRAAGSVRGDRKRVPAPGHDTRPGGGARRPAERGRRDVPRVPRDEAFGAVDLGGGRSDARRRDRAGASAS